MPTTPKAVAAADEPVVAEDDGTDAPVPDHPNIYAALAAFQRHLPPLTKGSTANVPTKSGGSYSYSYADLSVLVEAILPMLAAQGISWVCVPTVEEGKLILRHGLFHGASNTSIEGVYALPERGTPQEIGSAITYARRYTLLSLTGTFPAGEDDDGEKASDAYRKQSARQSRAEQPQAERPQAERPQAERPQPAAPAVDPDAPLVTDSDQIAAAATLEELRDIYRSIAAAKQLDRYLPTGEALRDAIKARQVQIVAESEPVTDNPPAEQAAFEQPPTAVDPDSDPA